MAGGGMVGLVTAALLAQSPGSSNLRITVLDAGKLPLFDIGNDIALRVSAVSQGSMQILRELEVWKSIADIRACPYRRMRVWDSRESVEGPNTLRFDAADFALGELGFIVENVLIQHALLERLRELEVDVCFETPIQKVRVATASRATEIQLQDGRGRSTPAPVRGRNSSRGIPCAARHGRRPCASACLQGPSASC